MSSPFYNALALEVLKDPLRCQEANPPKDYQLQSSRGRDLIQK